ncbi:WecB/TagA/CpsF family glycosyltransferase [Nocardioides sp. Leaf307]|uniref:WecB/TagA/CpsF family glycosyltransferase n=1 Tax=Nocardioides sp. Leaf307 TaxID=1736331 RepID=UPI0009EB5F3B|nr:WecB/TagA/CpsF family glycosyltransferase [Nocardioides sp. Leaf307]
MPVTIPRASVVIPAHNEEHVIGRCLDRLAQSPASSELEVVVVANGCTDRTVQVARTYRNRLPHLVVVDEVRPGKVSALNRGDSVATTFPRVYLDADIELEPAALEPLLARLDSPEARVAAPQVTFDTSRCSPWVRAYYTVFQSLPYVTDGLVGLGLYAVTEAGRRRFGRFPDLTADDLFVQRHFSRSERETTPGSFVVHTPRTVRDLVRVRSRVAAGNAELAQAGASPEVAAADTRHTTGGTVASLVAWLRRRPSRIGVALVYVAITAAARVATTRQTSVWLRDDSSRTPQATVSPARRTGGADTDAPSTRVHLDGVDFDAVDEAGAVDHVLLALEEGRGGLLVTPNVDILRQLRRDACADVAAGASLVVADGMPIVWASRLLGTPLPARVTGSSLVWSLSAALAQRSGSIYLLGGAPGVAERAGAALCDTNPGLRLAGHLAPPFGFDRDPEQLAAVVDEVSSAAPDVVFVALGFPKQERTAAALRERMPQTWFLGCGGSLDMAAGDVRRAPAYAQRWGGEWIVRLVQEPRRLARRYLVDDIPYALGLMLRTAARRVRGR